MNKKLIVSQTVLLIISIISLQIFAAETRVTKYCDNRKGAMALNFDTELYMGGMIHSESDGYNPATAATRAQATLDGWPNIIADCETYDIPVSFNICGYEAVFGDSGRRAVSDIDILQPWHPDPHWSTSTWYSDMPLTPTNYKTVGSLSGQTRSFSLVYGGPLTEQTLNSFVPFEISYHNFGHESLSSITAENMDDTFRLGVAYHKRIGSKLTAEAPPWNDNPQAEKYPIFVENGIFVFNRYETGTGLPYEVIDNLWVVSRNGYFTVSSDMTGDINSAIESGIVFAHYSHPEDGFYRLSRGGFQKSLAYAKSRVDSGDLWATTLSEIGRYSEAKSDVNMTTTVVSSDTVRVDINLTNYDAQRFGIPYLTFVTTMPNAASYAKITVDYPSAQALNSIDVRISDANVIYTIFLNPAGTTNVDIKGVAAAYTGGVIINMPVLTADSTPPAEPLADKPINIKAQVNSTDALYSVNIIYQRNSDAKDSKIMNYNAADGAWQTTIGPFAASDHISYYVSATDNSGRRERSSDKSFNVQAPDITSPTPNPMTWATQPHAVSSSSISMTATTAADISGIEYFFECTAGNGHNSAWQSSPVYTDTGLNANTQYYYRVRARDRSSNLNQTAFSAAVSATTLGSVESIYETEKALLSGPVVSTAVAGYSGTGFADYRNASTDYIQWTVNVPSAGQYQLQFRYALASGNRPLAIMVNGTVVAASLAFPETDIWSKWSTVSITATLNSGTNTVRTTAIGYSGPNMDYLNVIASGATDTTTPTPNPMTWAAQPNAVSSSSISMTATTATGPSGVEYVFECTAGNGHNSAWQSSPAYTDTGLNAKTQYSYRVRARDKIVNQNQTVWSVDASATTLAPPPGAPTNLAFVRSNKKSITIRWIDNASNEQGFYIERSADGSAGPWTRITTAGIKSTSYVNTNLPRKKTYWYRVQAYNNAAGVSAYSNVISCSTR